MCHQILHLRGGSFHSNVAFHSLIIPTKSEYRYEKQRWLKSLLTIKSFSKRIDFWYECDELLYQTTDMRSSPLRAANNNEKMQYYYLFNAHHNRYLYCSSAIFFWPTWEIFVVLLISVVVTSLHGVVSFACVEIVWQWMIPSLTM